MKWVIWFITCIIVLSIINYNFYSDVRVYGRFAVFIFEAGLFILFNLIFNFSWLFIISKKNKANNREAE